MRRQVASEKRVSYEKATTHQGEKQQLTLRTEMPWRHQAPEGSCYSYQLSKEPENPYFLNADSILYTYGGQNRTGI